MKILDILKMIVNSKYVININNAITFGLFFILSFGAYIYISNTPLYKLYQNKDLMDFITPVECRPYEELTCNATDYMKAYRVMVVNTPNELEVVKKGIAENRIVDISSFYELRIGDFIKYDLDDKKFIRISKSSPSHYTILD